MKSRGSQRELLAVARRLVWWKPPPAALRDRRGFLAQVMALGAWNDVAATRRHCSDAELRETLRDAPPGVFDARSWSYWHRLLGESRVPPLPHRRLP